MTAPRTPQLPSRLPHVGTTIFSVMSALAAECGAVNLGQGFPDFDCDPALLDRVNDAMREGLNQYPPMAGVPALRQAVAAKIAALYGRAYDPEREITVTAGATQAILTAVLACVHPGDEVVVLEPCYDSYAPNIELAGGTVVRVPLTPGTFRPDFARIAAAIGPRTRAIIVNTPHNPAAVVWTRAEMQRLAEILAPTEVLLIADEVYEHMVFDGAGHVSASAIPELAARAFVVSSFGKTFHVTGWKVGTVAAPAALTAEFRKVHQFNVFTVNTPMQHALARYLADPAPYLGLAAFYQRKRDLFRAGLAASRLKLLPCEGSYFQSVDYSAVSDLPEADFCRWLTREVGVAAIPISAFYDGGFEQRIARLCFAKRDDTLERALERLARL
ncbi:MULTISPECIES: pyridoxal phosphate-dependent aminotransferase [unclassified Rubrivivax]|uniref:pyridoxal phosphate-dependent aminotransferase n=1 Tax=unclassified Rubrivivax TaxID=2649762 RepID=UPI001E55F028|nr:MULTISPECIES: pyridoxal phosphate-dependent aminotransferase [unclassified Rubrivivax]MCC9597749.1 pyridoxal phosphate-dependent aminotransferase [Rubrivivax sp. JA1055]MCC9645993.1 pyridoxal phosphate-dependent aminotransferase [Rubrivivax sp. JA1029]